jgi:polar amino acid transport system substrate-binding protein
LKEQIKSLYLGMMLLLGSNTFAPYVYADDSQAVNNIQFYTEISPPYFWLDENNQPQGAVFDLANALMAQTQLTGTIEHLPWARAYVEAKDKSNIVLLTALRTPEREAQLQWLGVVHNVQAHLIALKGNKNIEISSLEQAKNYVVGTIRGYGSANYLINNGFNEGKKLKLLSSQSQLWSMLYKERIDLVLDNFSTGKYQALKAGFDSEGVQVVFNIKALNANLELATGMLTDGNTAQRLRLGLAQLKKQGTLDQIMQKWGL